MRGNCNEVTKPYWEINEVLSWHEKSFHPPPLLQKKKGKKYGEYNDCSLIYDVVHTFSIKYEEKHSYFSITMALHHKPVLVLDVQHLFIHFLHGHLASKHCCYGEITAMPGITSSHHVLAVKHLLSQFRYSKSTVLLWTATGQRCKPWHEEVKAGEWDHVDRQLPQVSIQLKWAQGKKFYLLKTWMIN